MWILVTDQEFYPMVQRFDTYGAARDAYIDAATIYQDRPKITVFLAQVDSLKGGVDYRAELDAMVFGE